jgi:hypothetical protein
MMTCHLTNRCSQPPGQFGNSATNAAPEIRWGQRRYKPELKTAVACAVLSALAWDLAT